jgi:N-glycosylase/DNA lyase
MIRKISERTAGKNTIDFGKVIRKISKDRIVKTATKRFAGLRLLRQDPFQCYISFIVSANSNIQNIRLSLYRLTKKLGKKVRFDGKEFFLFPDANKLAGAGIAELSSCGFGYRTRYVHSASKAVRGGTIDFELLKKSDYHAARDELCKVDGIGNKVADCIMLFSLEKTEAFPLDRWMVRALHDYYPGRFSIGAKSLTERRYHTLHDELREYFGEYAGYCQQFLFKLIRDSNQKRW